MSDATYSTFPPIPGPPFHAWFSATAARFAGSGIWEREDGTEVEITLAHHDRKEAETLYGWDDSVYVGMVVRRLRNGQIGDYNPSPVPNNLSQLYVP